MIQTAPKLCFVEVLMKLSGEARAKFVNTNDYGDEDAQQGVSKAMLEVAVSWLSGWSSLSD